ncbi:hypothetical protein HID58_013582 [Brassica napus]|uniref:Uncharacterized protein n=1 Tax=Brassica napus TaxID=3708 RepID=A0ABQ8E4A5_BRANA|nr:hypothetical protein HID58_013582 [Brassica napus]
MALGANLQPHRFMSPHAFSNQGMHELFEKMRNHRVNIDGNVSTVLFTTLVLERFRTHNTEVFELCFKGWQRKLDPGYDIMRTLQKMLLKTDWMKSLSYTVDGLMAP